MISDDARAVEAPVTEPPRRWRNWWRVYVKEANVAPLACAGCGWLPGEQMPTPCGCYPPFPSKDAAETDAAENIRLLPPNLQGYVEYLGAYPEGERP